MVSPNSEKVLNYLKANYGTEFKKQDIADALGISLAAVIGTINSFVKKGYVEERMEEVEVAPATETRKAQVKIIRYEKLNEAGLAYDPVAEDAARTAAKEAEKARKAEERAARKAAQ